MKNDNSLQNQIVVFPENTGSVIAELLQRYGLKETPKDVSEKIHKGEEPFGTTIAKLVKEIAEGKVQLKYLPDLFQKKLTLSATRAKQMAIDIKKEILDLVERPEEKTPPLIAQKATKEKSLSKEDIYREPIK